MGAIRGLLAGLAVLAVVGGSAPAFADDADVNLAAGLNGQRERPNAGDPNGSGIAHITVDPATGLICYELTVRNIDPATAAHIHRGSRDVAGPVVQGLAPPTDGTSSGCVTNSVVAAALAEDPAGYYVNVHNPAYPAGAVRGQLAGG
ncbi:MULTISPECIES: CHRD domain-containing protein [Nocardioides]|uniref:CHRD domain-containing protein n=1 Tax=Nocardioides vastitatis TaxID=2568655 RepID=A0ABW0ZMT3_9ACTN|nr:CHRD domain-containing protein [Nocardioides sp.]THI94390.1 CHRD domain-containing protein [Nocardioides sp.]